MAFSNAETGELRFNAANDGSWLVVVVALREDFGASELRGFARKTKDAALALLVSWQKRRLT